MLTPKMSEVGHCSDAIGTARRANCAPTALTTGAATVVVSEASGPDKPQQSSTTFTRVLHSRVRVCMRSPYQRIRMGCLSIGACCVTALIQIEEDSTLVDTGCPGSPQRRGRQQAGSGVYSSIHRYR